MRFRGLRRGAVGARVDSAADIEWLLAIDRADPTREAKAREFSPERLQRLVLSHTRGTTIFVIDRADIVDGYVEFLPTIGASNDGSTRPLTKLENDLIARGMDFDIDQIGVTSRVEWMLETMEPDFGTFDEARCRSIPSLPRPLGRDARERNEFELRAGAVYADGFDLRTDNHAIAQYLEGRRWVSAGQLNALRLREVVRVRREFDIGQRPVFEMLQAGFRSTLGVLEEVAWNGAECPLSAGALLERDSRESPLIRAADFMAACAADIYECASGSTADRARALKRHFDRVFVNGDWVA